MNGNGSSLDASRVGKLSIKKKKKSDFLIRMKKTDNFLEFSLNFKCLFTFPVLSTWN
jgi:hypothetical protein